MPSLHVGISVLFALVAWRRSRVVGVVLWLYAVVIQIGSVILAWHYAVDGYLGAVFAVVSWKAALAFVPQRDSALS
jgi:membrane-associated phospholipid phosphatase